MILTPHAIVGATLANIFPSDPALGFGLAFLSHYVLDMLPHKDYNINNFLDTKTKTVKSILKNTGAILHFLFIVLDFVIAVFLCFLFFVRDEKSATITFLGIMGGLLPDLFKFLYYKYKHEPWIFFQKIDDRIHFVTKNRKEEVLGILFPIFLLICVLVIYFL